MRMTQNRLSSQMMRDVSASTSSPQDHHAELQPPLARAPAQRYCRD
eukprot:CAMPEP_0185843606 /NCGR_PEP_ID=MMETSP1354-20130828/34_1 /TAXON_ID=708628 /ORGANISM="Erythrolobus madagascarensis, Strain CCMP3276" /LENGTH=45 /DNA_ID= /DNA_START= /DNA_END= /DNA_ORIENTATION=